jgi:outer membrane protein OmpA-like peptidoglycan-associated protein
MTDEFGFEIGSSEAYEGHLEELLDRLEAQEGGGYLSEVSSSSGSRPGARSRPCPARSAGTQPTDALDRFDVDKAELKPFHHEIVQRLGRQVAASWSTQHPIRVIRVVGYTDPVGTKDYNLALGMRRARQVQSALSVAIELQRRAHWRVRVAKVNTVVVITPSTEGVRDPVANNGTPEGRACNRRVEVFLEAAGPWLTGPPPPACAPFSTRTATGDTDADALQPTRPSLQTAGNYNSGAGATQKPRHAKAGWLAASPSSTTSSGA